MKAFIFSLLFLVSHTAPPEQPSGMPVFEPVAFGSSKVPVQEGKWQMIPTVYVCPNAPVSKSRVERAMNIWKRHGFETNGPIMNSTTPACLNGTYSFGNFDKTTHEVLGARIEIKEKWANKDRVLEHEFGHAFGWKHYARRYHLMHPIHDVGGWDMTGLRNKR